LVRGPKQTKATKIFTWFGMIFYRASLHIQSNRRTKQRLLQSDANGQSVVVDISKLCIGNLIVTKTG
jgi:hypothetical protein